MRLILLAAPGAGKGTQAEMLSEHYGIPSISTGAILRKNIGEGTELGKIAEGYINAGKLIPDDLMIRVMDDRFKENDCKNGFILDGFPRTIAQAESLDASPIEIDKVLSLEVDDETIVERLSGRLECKSCGATYHREYNPTKVEGICDKCGGELGVRSDDKPETVRARLKTYHEQTEPLIDYYKEKGILRVAKGREEIADTCAAVLEALEA